MGREGCDAAWWQGEDGDSSERWARCSQDITSDIIYTYFRGKSGPRKHIMMVISGTKMINPNFSSSANAVFFITIFFF